MLFIKFIVFKTQSVSKFALLVVSLPWIDPDIGSWNSPDASLSLKPAAFFGISAFVQILCTHDRSQFRYQNMGRKGGGVEGARLFGTRRRFTALKRFLCTASETQQKERRVCVKGRSAAARFRGKPKVSPSRALHPVGSWFAAAQETTTVYEIEKRRDWDAVTVWGGENSYRCGFGLGIGLAHWRRPARAKHTNRLKLQRKKA